ncbi:MAG: class I SAM-dependent DNA methyltransferase [Chloroflexi bacterium]|nr:class I SAM-dependent DNA methyltransferase [Chloroflexota bacterium]
MPSLTPQQFVDKWRNVTLKERSAAQEHFIDLCHMLGHETPAQADRSGASFAFEAGVSKSAGGQGFADVWKRGYFAWEYKGVHANLDKAYQQLLQYHEALESPPLLVVSDMQVIEVHTKFDRSVKKIYRLTLDDLLTADGYKTLRAVFTDPDALRAGQTTEQVTQEAAREFARLAEILRKYGTEPHAVARYLIRLLFCLFAEDAGLLPAGLFTRLVEQGRKSPQAFAAQARALFGAMRGGGWFGADEIAHFNGGLFADDHALELPGEALEILRGVSRLDWSSIEPSIFGTLFERGLDPDRRSQLGAHFTSRDDIVLLVEPVLMSPLRRLWASVQAGVRDMAAKRDAAKGASRTRLHNQIAKLLRDFADQIAATTVLDPACGSGNFLYVSLQLLHDLEKAVIRTASELGIGSFFPGVSPAQLRGIEINPYAHELAQTTIWIGHIQWMRDNGFGTPDAPILRPLDTITEMDAILAHDAHGKPVEPAWPNADVIVGNPPFLGGKRLRTELGDKYIDDLFVLYEGRVPHEADLVCYWFEKARGQIEAKKTKRAGLLATQGIRGGANREVLKRIKDSGDIFWAQSDREWVLDGANVHVSMVGFDDGSETNRILNGIVTANVNPDLTGTTDLTMARSLTENLGISFMGDTKGGAFDISDDVAQTMLHDKGNPNRLPNSDVVRPWVNGFGITRRSREMWIIDFGKDMPEKQASQYERPFEYVKTHVRPERLKNNREAYRRRWWLHVEARPAMRDALEPLPRFIATITVAKYRLFSWLRHPTLPDHALIVFARDDDYFFGVLHSKVHELWALRKGTALEDRPRYTPTSTFETFPLPWPPGHEPKDDPRVTAIADAARELVAKRDAWLNPPGATPVELKQRTLTKLYNERPTWLDLLHRALDAAVCAAYGWPADLPDDDILARLLALNLERAASHSPMPYDTFK